MAGCRSEAETSTSSSCCLGFDRWRAEAGREPASLEVTIYGVDPDAEAAKRFRDAGLDRAVFRLPAAGPDEVLPLLDQCAEVARQTSG